ncbi:MAG: hypothetical protein ACRETS_13285 [Steroidobacteraceae bacterium]
MKSAAPWVKCTAAAISPLATAGGAHAAGAATDPASCRVVRMPDIGCTDVTATTAVFANLLRRRPGYQPEITVLSVPVTYASMKNKDI